MGREYRVMASSMSATYSAGRHIAESPQEACELAAQSYRQSPLGRSSKDVGAFRFYTVDEFPYERERREEANP